MLWNLVTSRLFSRLTSKPFKPLPRSSPGFTTSTKTGIYQFILGTRSVGVHGHTELGLVFGIQIAPES